MSVETEFSIDIYLEKYCEHHGCSVEEAKKHAMVREVEKYYNEILKTGGV